MKLVRELDGDWIICVDHAGDEAVCDSEGDLLFWIPDSMATGKGGFAEGIIDPVLADMAKVVWLEKSNAFERGESAGRDKAGRDLQHLLGMDRLITAVEQLERT